MTNFDTWLLVLCVFGLLVALGATSGVVNEQLWVSEPLACALAGIALGPAAAGLLHLDPAASPTDAAILREAARVTLAIAVTGAAMRLPAYWLRLNWRGLGVSLVPGMVLMWGAGSAVAAVTLGLPLLPSLLLGAAIAPTDPVLSAPILSGRLARRAVPETLRDAMTAESGINDWLALPFAIMPVLLIRHAPAEAGLDWVCRVLAWEIGGPVWQCTQPIAARATPRMAGESPPSARPASYTVTVPGLTGRVAESWAPHQASKASQTRLYLSRVEVARDAAASGGRWRHP